MGQREEVGAEGTPYLLDGVQVLDARLGARPSQEHEAQPELLLRVNGIRATRAEGGNDQDGASVWVVV